MPKFRIVLVLLACWLCSFLAFDSLWKHPGEILVSDGGDGIKNYYTPIWYTLHDSAAHFSGMLYPYGDNYVFADAQPLLSSALQWYHTHVGELTAYNVIATVNMAMLIGLSLCCLLLYLLLRENRLPWLYALGTAVLITLLSPQILRFNGHYGLSYAFAVPLVWLLCHYALTAKRYVLWAIALALSLGMLELLHVYYLLICGMFAGLYAMFGLLTHLKQWKPYLVRAIAIVVAVLLPFITFQLWLASTSAVNDRVAVPYGIEMYMANFQSIFLPPYKPLLSGKHADFEGIAYVGFLGLPVLALFLYKFLGYLIRFRLKLIGRPVLPTPLQTALWPAVVIFFFSIGVPLLSILDWLPDNARQFRSLGRFAWVFYYVFAALGAFTLYQLYRYMAIRGARKLATFILLLALGFWAYEVQLYIRPLQQGLLANYKSHTSRELLAEVITGDEARKYGLSTGRYQAILPLSFFMTGSEKFGANVEGVLFYRCVQTSLKYSLPIAACNMSRTSLSRTAKLWQLFSAPVIDREYLKDLGGDERPFLLIHNGGVLNAVQQRMLQQSDLLFVLGNCSFYNMPFAALQPPQTDYYAAYQLQKDSLANHGELRVSQPGFYYEQDYNGEPNHNGFSQSGALSSVNDTIWIAKALDIAASQDTLEVSFWTKIDPKYWGMGEVFGMLTNDSTQQYIYVNPSDSWDTYHNWLRMSILLNPTAMPSKLDLLLKGKYLTIDQLMIKPLHADVYKPLGDSDTVLYNNYFIYPGLGLKTK